MEYTESYHALKNLSSPASRHRTLDGSVLVEFPFFSESHTILPGSEHYHCLQHGLDLDAGYSFYTEIGTLQDDVHKRDIEVQENRAFRYTVIRPEGSDRCRRVTFLLHGFNEKDWQKYLPWAQAICKGTQSAVVLFPLAFHMQRAPLHWSSKREMYRLSEERKQRFPNIIHSTLSNVAISMRLHSMPQRFIWSGLLTYYDILQFMAGCKEGGHPVIHPEATFDLFAYSIGGFLAQILKLTNHNGYFGHSKVCLFCSGATFNRFSPVSKFILDSEANVALYSYLVEHFDKMLEKDNHLRHYILEGHPEGKVFYAMLDYKKMRDFREGLLRQYGDHICAFSLARDEVIPHFEIVNTLQGAYRDIPVRVEELDLGYEYIHENPFPVDVPDPRPVDAAFRMAFERVCDFLNG